MTRIKHLILDVDDTLYPRSSGLLPALDARIEEYMRARLPVDDETITEMRKGYWKRYGTTMGGLVAEHGIDPEEYISFIHDVPVAEYVAPNPRLDRLLDRIPATKTVLTNSASEYAQRVLAALGVERHFDHIFGIRTCGYLGKPNRGIYEHVMRVLGARPEECLFVDDSRVNILGARELGIETVHVDCGDGCAGDHAIGAICELETVLAEIGLLT